MTFTASDSTLTNNTSHSPDQPVSLFLNGKLTTSNTNCLHAFIEQVTGYSLDSQGRSKNGKSLGIAVALNAQVVPRTQWLGTSLCQNDAIELVTARQGG